MRQIARSTPGSSCTLSREVSGCPSLNSRGRGFLSLLECVKQIVVYLKGTVKGSNQH